MSDGRGQTPPTSRSDPNEVTRIVEDLRSQAFDLSHAAIHITRADGTIAAVNPAFCDLLGVTAEEAIGAPLVEIVSSGEPPDALRDRLDQLDRSGLESTRALVRMVRKGGMELWVDSATKLARDAAGRLVCFMSVGIDVTERTEAEARLMAREAELWQSERRFRAGFEGSPVALSLRDFAGGPVTVNMAMADLVGRSVEETERLTLTDIVHPEDLPALAAASHALASGESDTYSGEHRYLRADGGVVDVLVSATSIRDESGRPAQLLNQAIDITAARRASAALFEAKELFRTAFETAPVGLAILGIDGIVQQVNPAICEITGYTEAELLGRTAGFLVIDEDRGADTRALREVIEGAQSDHRREVRIRDAAGRPRWLILSRSLVNGVDGQPLHIISQAQDITELKVKQEELLQLSERDPLTGLYNRRRFDQELARLEALARRHGPQAAVVMFDLDSLKAINDGAGHEAGDTAIVAVADAIRRRVRETDLVARLGGDEFGVILAGSEVSAAMAVAEEVRGTLAGLTAAAPAGAPLSTVSAGVATVDGSGKAISDADTAMYEAKGAGGNRVSLAAGS